MRVTLGSRKRLYVYGIRIGETPVKRYGPVFDIPDVVADALGNVGIAAQAVDLRPAGAAGADLLAHQIARDLLLEMLYMIGHLGPRAD